jgi:hypothetical protein
MILSVMSTDDFLPDDIWTLKQLLQIHAAKLAQVCIDFAHAIALIRALL